MHASLPRVCVIRSSLFIFWVIVDSSTTLLHSRHLVGLPPSTSPPPLGERNRQSERTASHFESHTMGDHEDEIPEMSSPPHEFGEEYPTLVYYPSLKIPWQSGYDPSFIGYRYWLLGDETRYEPTSTSHVRYGMFDILAPDPAHHVELKAEPSTMLGGTPIPFHAERFGSTSHITPSIPVVEATSHAYPRPSVSSHMCILELRWVTIGNTTYIPSHFPLSLNITPSNAFLKTLPPPHSRGPSGQNIATSHVHTTTTRMIVSQSQVPLVVLGGHIPIFGSSCSPSHGVPHIPTYGASHGQYYGPQYG